MKTVMFICKRCILQVIHDKRNISGRKKKHSQIKSFDTGGVGGIRSLRRRGRLRWGCHVPAAPPASPCSSHLRTRSPAAPSYFWSGSRGDRNVGLGPHWWFETFTHRHGGDTHLLQIQDSGLYPGHLHLLIHLVDVAFDQTHGQSFHHQQLHLQDNSRHCFFPIQIHPRSLMENIWHSRTLTSFTGTLVLWAISVKVNCLWLEGRVKVICGRKDKFEPLQLSDRSDIHRIPNTGNKKNANNFIKILKPCHHAKCLMFSVCVCVYSHLHDTQQLDFLHQFRLMGCEVRL